MRPEARPSDLQAALVLSDIVDSTGLTASLGDEVMSDLWAAHDRSARQLIREWRGSEIDRSDGFLVFFATADDALGFSLGYQRAIAVLPVPLQARIGIHVGRCIVRDVPAIDVANGAKRVEIDGIAKPITARIMSIACGGQVLLSGETRARLRQGDVTLHSHGHWLFKGLDEPMELFEAGDAATVFQLPQDVAKAYRVDLHDDGRWSPRRKVAHSLPAERDAFVGRRDVLRQLFDRIESGARIVNMLGAGGVGKTRLAQHFGWAWLGSYEGGVWFCDLTQAASMDGLVHAVAKGLNLPLTNSTPIVQIGDAIAGRGQCLMIVDNFEQVADLAEATLGCWVERAAEARFIVTSREVLGIKGEVVQPVAPLDEADGVRLFLHRAAEASSVQAMALSESTAVAPLVKLLDGLPLAIELAAARVRVLSPRQLLDRMSERFSLLAAQGGRPARHTTLRATLDWSWDLLNSDERAALAELSVFDGGFDESAAGAALGPHGQPAHRTLDLVQSLLDKSLLRPTARGRFGMLASVREYAAECLRSPGRFEGSGEQALRDTELRHARHFATFDVKRATATARDDLENLVAACRHATRWADEDAAIAALQASWTALRLRGPFAAGYALATACRSMSGLREQNLAIIERVCGAAQQKRGNVQEARRHFDAALVHACRAGDLESEAWCLTSMAELALNTGDVTSSGRLYAEAQTRSTSLGNALLECVVLSGHAAYLESTSQFAEARFEYQRALDSARRAGDRRSEGGCLGNLGQFLANQGDAVEAQRYLRESLAIARELGDRQWEGNALCNLGLLEQTAQHLDEALDLLAMSLRIARELGHVRLECIVLCNVGMVHDAAEHWEQAERCFHDAIDVARRLGDRRSEGQFLGYLGSCCARQQKWQEAIGAFDDAMDLSESVSDHWNVGLVMCRKVEAEVATGQFDRAQSLFDRAMSLALELKPPEQSDFGVALVEAQHSLRTSQRAN